MSKLNSKQQDILRLIMRSKPDHAGWFRVSGSVWQLVDGALPADLVELRPDENGGHLRLTDRGQAVGDYL